MQYRGGLCGKDIMQQCPFLPAGGGLGSFLDKQKRTK
jgi:hypothetical protein